MARGGSPLRPEWLTDPVVDAGFAAAYPPEPPAEAAAPELAQPEFAAPEPAAPEPAAPELGPPEIGRDLRTDLAARRRASDGRRVRAPRPGRLGPGRALAGAALSVAGVCLGLGVLLWVSDDPSQGPGPTVAQPEAGQPEAGQQQPAATVPVLAAVPTPAAAASSPVVPTLVVPVTVLNNSNRAGLAAQAAERFVAGGWPVTGTGNFRGQIPVSTVYYDPGLQASAQAFADTFAGIVRVLPRFASLPATGVVVVLTREFDAA